MLIYLDAWCHAIVSCWIYCDNECAAMYIAVYDVYLHVFKTFLQLVLHGVKVDGNI